MGAIAILISPTGERFFNAYGPMTKDRKKATVFINKSVALNSTMNRYGRGETGFWNSERAHFIAAKKQYAGWTAEIKGV